MTRYKEFPASSLHNTLDPVSSARLKSLATFYAIDNTPAGTCTYALVVNYWAPGGLGMLREGWSKDGSRQHRVYVAKRTGISVDVSREVARHLDGPKKWTYPWVRITEDEIKVLLQMCEPESLRAIDKQLAKDFAVHPVDWIDFMHNPKRKGPKVHKLSDQQVCIKRMGSG